MYFTIKQDKIGLLSTDEEGRREHSLNQPPFSLLNYMYQARTVGGHSCVC